MKFKIKRLIFCIFLISLVVTITNTTLAAYSTIDSNYDYTQNSESNRLGTTYSLQNSISTTMQNRLFSSSTYASSSFDLRDVIDINVKDQKSVDSCWTYAATSAVETNMALKYGYSSIYSPRHMEYATSKTFLDGINPIGFNREVNDGGNPDIALAYLTNGSGLVLEEDMPFEESTSKINLSEIDIESVAQVKEYKNFASIDKKIVDGVTKYYKEDGTEYTQTELTTLRNEIKSHIVSNGGLIARTNITEKQYFDNSDINEVTSYYCDDSSISSNHEVVIIGWDDNYSKNNFNASHRPSTNGAYLVLNSYGEGENGGCYYISYEDILIESDLVGIVSATDKEYKNIYQYDELGPSVSYWPTLMDLVPGQVGRCSELYATNVYSKKETGTEYVTEIGLSAINDVVADIYVLPNASTLDISKATLVASNVSLTNGYKTIELSSPIRITGSKFAIIAKYKDSEELIIPLEANLTENPELLRNNDLWDTAKSESGQSMYSIDGASGNWSDLNTVWTNSNFCIKAFTKTSDEEGPTITFGTNGDMEGKPEHSTTINVSDDSGINKNTLKYVWSQSTTAPDDSEFIEIFENGTEVSLEGGEGIWYLWVQAKDTQGNKTVIRSEGFNLIDDTPTAPVLSSNTPSGEYTNENVYITVTQPDGVGGYEYQYSINDGQTWRNVLDDMQIEVEREGETQIVAKAINSRGIESSYSNTWIVRINKTIPDIEGVRNNGVYTTSVTPTITDDLDYTIVLEKNGTVISYSEGQEISEEGKYELTVTDEAGNENVIVFYIDRQAPVISFTPNGGRTNQGEINTKVDVSDDSSIPVDGLKYLWSTQASNITEDNIKEQGTYFNNNQELTKTINDGETWYLWIYAQDSGGNSVVTRSNAFYYDSTAPVIEFSYNTDSDIYAKQHSVTVNVTDANQEISTLKYVWTQNSQEPSEDEFTSNFTNGQAIVKQNGSGNWYLWIMAVDEAGNTAKSSSKVLKFDNEVPGKPTITANINNGDITNKEVVINIEGNSTVSGLKRYEISLNNGGSWQEVEQGTRVTASNEGIYSIIARTVNNVDTNGENSDVFTFTIDTTKPTISYPIEGEQYEEVTPVIEDTNDFTVTLKKDNVQINYTYNEKITENGSYELIATDEAGNEAIVKFTIKNVYPIINFGTDGNSTYSKEHKTVVNVTDDDLEADSLMYVWTQSLVAPRANAEWTNFTNGQEIIKNTESGTWYLWVQASDSVGNTTIKNTKGFNLDNEIQEIPTVSANIQNNGITNTDVEITLNAKETLSGIDKYQYSLNSGDTWNNVEGNSFTIKDEGSYSIITRAINNVGTLSENSEEFVVKIDKTKPVINNIVDGDTYEEVTIDVADNGNYEIILLKNGEEISCKNGDKITTPGVYTLTVIDEAKNQTSVSFSIPEPEVDEQGPVVSFTTNGNTIYAKTQSTRISLTDESGIDETSLKYLWKNDTNMPEEEDFTESFENEDEIVLENVSGKYYLWIMAKDTLGNQTITRSNVFYIDNTTPTTPNVEIIQNEEENTVIMNLSGSTSESEVTYQYTTDNGETWNNVNGTQIIITNIGTTNISFRSINEVGNVSEETDSFEVVIEDVDDNNPSEENPSDGNDSNEDNNQGNGNNSDEEQNEVIDNTVSKDPIPQAGIQNVAIVITIIVGIVCAVIAYIKSKKII